jgi:hypothetical protein
MDPGEKLTGGGETSAGEFGDSVALSSNGNTALVGGPTDNTAIGAAWVLTHSGTKWEQQGGKLTAKSGEEKGESNFGSSVALSSEGNTALIGGPTDNTGVGAAWVSVNTAPTVETKPALAPAQTTATLNATVNPNGGEVSKCEFEYSTTISYGKTASCASLPGSGTSAVAVSASVTGLAANTTYHFRISATNAGGTSKGADQEFKTLANAPTITVCPASLITQTSATLCGKVNPDEAEVTECKFEYGTTTPYGSSAPCTPPPGSGGSPVEVSAPVTHGPRAEHHLPLQDLSDQRRRHEQRP